MEGMFDGSAVDSCFFCALLYPDDYVDDCPRCGRRMFYLPAVMMSPADLDNGLAQHLTAYQHAADSASRRTCLIALLTYLHRFAPAAAQRLAARGGPTLDALRTDFESLAEPASQG